MASLMASPLCIRLINGTGGVMMGNAGPGGKVKESFEDKLLAQRAERRAEAATEAAAAAAIAAASAPKA